MSSQCVAVDAGFIENLLQVLHGKGFGQTDVGAKTFGNVLDFI